MAARASKVCALLVLIASVACGSRAELGDGRPADPPPRGAWLVYWSHGKDEGRSLLAIRMRERLTPVRLTEPGERIQEAAWSPNGRWLAYATIDDEYVLRIWLRSVEGSSWASAQLARTYPSVGTRSRVGVLISWSHEGRHLLVQGPEDLALVTTGGDGSILVQNVEPPSNPGPPSNIWWAPGSARFAWTTHPLDAASAVHIGRVVEGPTSPSVESFTVHLGEDLYVSLSHSIDPYLFQTASPFSAAGDYLSIEAFRNDNGASSLSILAVASSTDADAVEVVWEMDDGDNLGMASWSSVGSRIVYAPPSPGNTLPRHWFVFDPATTQRVELGELRVAKWVPGSDSSLVAENADGRLLHLDLASLAGIKVSAMAGGAIVGSNFSMAPDGRWVTYGTAASGHRCAAQHLSQHGVGPPQDLGSMSGVPDLLRAQWSTDARHALIGSEGHALHVVQFPTDGTAREVARLAGEDAKSGAWSADHRFFVYHRRFSLLLAWLGGAGPVTLPDADDRSLFAWQPAVP